MSDLSAKGFNIVEAGFWPEESYYFYPDTSKINPLLGFIEYSNEFRYITNPVLNVENVETYLTDFNLTKQFDSSLLSYKVDYLDSSSRFVLNASAAKLNGYENYLKYFKLNIGSNRQNFYYAYLFYPKRIFLKPVRVVKNNENSYELTLSAVLLSANPIFFYTDNPDRVSVAPTVHRDYILGDYLNEVKIPTTLQNECNLFFDISSTQTIIKEPIISFEQDYNPINYTTILQNNNFYKRIRQDFTFIEFDVSFDTFSNLGLENLRTYYYDNPRGVAYFTDPINFNYNPATNKFFQTFLLVQSAVNEFVPIQHPTNAVLSATLDLRTTNFKYFAKSRYDFSRNTFVNFVTGQAGTDLTLSYIVDSSNLKNTTEPVQGTLISFNNNGNPSLSLGQSISSTIQGSDTVRFVTKYPPHYYSYNLYMNKPPRLSNVCETSNLTFGLSSISISETPTSVFVKTYLYSTYNTLTLDLEEYGTKDKIRYLSEYNDDNLLNSVSAFVVRPTQRILYDLQNPTWLNADEASVLEITYPSIYVGFPTITIRPVLSTLGGEIDAIFASEITLKGLDTPSIEDPYLIDVEVLDEGDDYIDLSVASLTSTDFYPGIDLRETRISWFVSTSADNNVKINYLLKGEDDIYKPINFINYSTARNLLFNVSSWAIRVSGYGPTTTYITLSSQLFNTTSIVETNSALFDYFADQKLLIGPLIELDNLNEIRTVTLTANIPYKGRQYNLPLDTLLYWEWNYDNELDPSFIPLTSKFIFNNTDYNFGETNISQEISGLRFFINPEKSLTTPIAHDVKISVFTTDTVFPFSATYEFDIDDFPAKEIFNADFDVRYNAFPNDIILNTRNGNTVLTREDNGTTLYDLKANTDIIPFINATNYRWDILRSTNPTVSTVFGLTSIRLDTANIYQTDVTFTVLSAFPEGWTFPHNVSQKITIYTVPTVDFNKSPSFILYPQFAWLNSPRLNILDNSNFRSFAASTTAYAYKKSNSEIYNVSASPTFNTFLYGYGDDRNYINELNSSSGQLEIPYTSEFFSNTGLTIHLTAYNALYPKNTPLLYKTIQSGNLITKSYNITARSIPYSNTTSNALKYFQNPKLVDYNSISYTFSATVTSYDLDVNRTIVINQKIFTNPLNSPAVVQPNNSTITYILSTPKWTSLKNVPPVDGTYPIFTLNVGDDANELVVNGTTINSLYLNATADLNIKIPPETFENYTFPEYTGVRDLWDEKQLLLDSNLTAASSGTWQTLVAFSTAAQPEIFLNTYYTVTATPVFVEFKTPTLRSNPISAYAVNFGEIDTNFTNGFDQTFYYQYSSTGTFYITYSAIYQDGSFKKFVGTAPFIVKDIWPEYNQESLRILNETILELPYTLDEVLIQPNEFGDSDIFNTAIQRLWECLEYLKSNIKTMNIDAPIAYYGWLGTNSENTSEGIRWYTSTYGSNYLNSVTNSISIGTSFFSNTKDIDITKNYIFVLDNKKFRIFKNDKNADEITFSNIEELEELVFDPKSIAVTEDENTIYVLDSARNKIYRFDFDFSDSNNPLFSLILMLGSFGSLNESNKFDFPSEIKYKNESLYVLDFNNKCVKQFNRDLSWLHTYYDDAFENDQLLNIAVHPNQMLYIIGKSLNIYVFDLFGETVYKSFKLSGLLPTDVITKIFFGENGEFLYVVTTKNVLKYTATGEYITTLILPEVNSNFISGQFSEYKSLNFATKNSIVRVQDFVEIFEIGDGLENKYWSLEQMLLNKYEFAQDLNYNSTLLKLNQNIKTFRNSLNSKFALVTEQTSRGTISYFSLIPISINDKPIFEDDIENEKLHIGVNEFHIPPVVNRELTKLYNSLLKLKTNLDVISTNSVIVNDTSECGDGFCWSWKSMSCYELSLPLIRICNVNPITYAELVDSFPVPYAPTKKWGQATSECCSEFVPPNR